MRLSLTLLAAAGVLSLGAPVFAQEPPPPVTMELRDASVREALKQLFDSANLQYQLDNDIRGFVTLKISKQPFENALKLLLRAGAQPLTYKLENGVYVVSVRRTTVTAPEAPPVEEPEPAADKWEFLPLTYIDPKALEPLIGPMLEVDHFRRWRQNQNNGPQGTGRGSGQQNQQGQPGIGLGQQGQFPGLIIGGTGNGNGLLGSSGLSGGGFNQLGRGGRPRG